MRAAVLVALALLVLPFAAPSAPALIEVTNATFVDASGVHPAVFSWSGPCNGSVRVNVDLLDGPGEPDFTFFAKSIMVPDLCSIACFDCPVPFSWTLSGAPGVLTGGGVAGLGAAWALHGPFAGGALEVRGAPIVVIG
jgi:hypothetical protein